MTNIYKATMWLSFLLFFSCQTNSKNSASKETKTTPTNVVLILADDMGYADLSCYGSKDIHTPNIDRLAANGLLMTDFHSSGVVCSPTRAALMTGMYPQEAGIEGVVTAKSHRHTGMSPEKYTIAEWFKSVGYTTALFGKWHLGYGAEYGPIVQGFDVFNGFVSGNIDYQSHIDQEGHTDWWEGKKLKAEEGYLTDIITNHAISFMDSVANKPFFLYLPHGAPHYPYQGPKDLADRSVGGDFPVLGSRKDRKIAYKEMIESLDQNVGRIVNHLKNTGQLENTLIIFSSDNGAARSAGSNAPYRGYKGGVYEGGHRVPAIFHWPEKIQVDTSASLMLSMDIFPTLVELVSGKQPDKNAFTGLSLASILLEQNDSQRERVVFWRFKGQKAVRKGKWKLVVLDNEKYLYDLAVDPEESNDLKFNNSDVLKELEDTLYQWESNLNEEIKA